LDLLPLRCHSDNNRKQHQRFLDDVAEVSEQHQAWIVVYAICPCCDLYALWGFVAGITGGVAD